MAIYVERTGIEACIKKIDAAIEELYSAAQSIDSAMNELPTYWQGTASNSAQATYAVDYKGLLTKQCLRQWRALKSSSTTARRPSSRWTTSFLEINIPFAQRSAESVDRCAPCIEKKR